MTNTAFWDVSEEYWSDEDKDEDDTSEVVRETGGYSDYGSEIDPSTPAKGERDLI